MTLKRTGIIYAIAFVSILIAVGSALFVGISGRTLPKESKFVQLFKSHRIEFDKLRSMLQEDSQLVAVADWGVRMKRSTDSLPAQRYNEYLRLLKQVDGQVATRDEGKHANPSIMIWGWGFAGHTKHLGICWLDEKPTNQGVTLDGYHGPGSYGHAIITYRHLETNWYLWTDL
ncbi:MAG TPA: hypothetical protein VFC44_18625 [Candidatus Saccharimonadales bacterium]|nr:hypothetical protein [Candidatus Saccharimonadales bacterium]